MLTWVFSGLVALVYVALLFVLVVAKNDIVDYVTGLPEWQQSSISPDMLMPVLWVGSLLFLAWSVGALVLAWFTWRRHNWARYLLVGERRRLAAGLGLFAFPVSLLHIVACIATIACLFTRPVARLVRHAHPRLLAAAGTAPRFATGPAAGTVLPPAATSACRRGPPPDQQGQTAGLVSPAVRARLRPAGRRSAAAACPSSSTSCSLQNAQRIRWRPSAEPSS